MPIGMLHIDNGIIVIELIGLVVEGLVVHQTQAIDGLYERIVLALVKLAHDGL